MFGFPEADALNEARAPHRIASAIHSGKLRNTCMGGLYDWPRESRMSGVRRDVCSTQHEQGSVLKVRAAELRSDANEVRSLINLLPNLQAVVFVGKKRTGPDAVVTVTTYDQVSPSRFSRVLTADGRRSSTVAMLSIDSPDWKRRTNCRSSDDDHGSYARGWDTRTGCV